MQLFAINVYAGRVPKVHGCHPQPVAEDLIARYTAFPWNGEVVGQAIGSFDALELNAAKILLIRLANELEDHLDLATLYSGPAKSKMDNNLPRFIELAEALGLPSLAAAFTTVYGQAESASVPAALRSDRQGSFVMVPKGPRQAAAQAGLPEAPGVTP